MSQSTVSAVVQIREHIRARYCRPERHGERIPPEREFMKRFDVSRPTVRSAMAGLVADGFLKRFPGRGTYVVDPGREHLPVNTRQATVSIISRVMHTTEGMAWITAALDQVYECGAAAIVNHCRCDVFREIALLRQAVERQVDGIVIHPMPMSALSPTLANTINELQLGAHMPVVLISESPLFPQATSVWIDEEDAGYRATRHLIELGHTRIAHVGFRTGFARRWRGYHRAMSESNLSVPADYELDISTVPHSDVSLEMGRNAGKILLSLKEPPTAVFAYWTELAAGILMEVTDRGMSCPGDMALIGMNHMLEEPTRSMIPCSITHMWIDMATLGKRAVIELMREMNGEKGGRRIEITAELREGVSTVGRR